MAISQYVEAFSQWGSVVYERTSILAEPLNHRLAYPHYPNLLYSTRIPVGCGTVWGKGKTRFRRGSAGIVSGISWDACGVSHSAGRGRDSVFLPNEISRGAYPTMMNTMWDLPFAEDGVGLSIFHDAGACDNISCGQQNQTGVGYNLYNR